MIHLRQPRPLQRQVELAIPQTVQPGILEWIHREGPSAMRLSMHVADIQTCRKHVQPEDLAGMQLCCIRPSGRGSWLHPSSCMLAGWDD